MHTPSDLLSFMQTFQTGDFAAKHSNNKIIINKSLHSVTTDMMLKQMCLSGKQERFPDSEKCRSAGTEFHLQEKVWDVFGVGLPAPSLVIPGDLGRKPGRLGFLGGRVSRV